MECEEDSDRRWRGVALRALPPLLWAGAGFALVHVATARFGPATSPDGVTYLSVARSLAAGRDFVRFDGLPYWAWPPLYPWAISLGVRAGLDAMESARLLGAACFAATLLALHDIVARRGSRWLASWACLAALTSPALLNTFSSVRSETLMIALLAGGWWLAERSRARPGLREAALLGAAAGLCWLTRYLGAVAACASGLWLWLAPGTAGRRMLRTAVFAGAAAAGIAAWELRQLLRHELGFAARGRTAVGAGRNLGEFLSTLADALHLSWLGEAAAPLAAAILVLLPALALWRVRRRGLGCEPALFVVALFALLYPALAIGVASWAPVAPLRQRFVAPLWLALLALVACLAAEAWRRAARGRSRRVLAGVLAVWLLPGLISTPGLVLAQRREGVGGLTSERWHRSPLIGALRDHHLGQRVLSNQPHAVYLHAALAAESAPHAHAYRAPARPSRSLEALRNRLERGEVILLAWFWRASDEYGYYTPVELQAMGYCLRREGVFSDGVLFALSLQDDCPVQLPPAS